MINIENIDVILEEMYEGSLSLNDLEYIINDIKTVDCLSINWTNPDSIIKEILINNELSLTKFKTIKDTYKEVKN